jgi:glyoxylase-like metal-dependent hydrolase (beta-lactamase superfamily II)
MHRFPAVTLTVGARTVIAVSDGSFVVEDGHMNVPCYQRRFAQRDGLTRVPIGAFLVPGEQTTLIDAGAGPLTYGSMHAGVLLDELAEQRVRPADVDAVALTHLHFDHIGWVAGPDSTPRFPNAIIYASAEDFDHFVVNPDPAAPRQYRLRDHLRRALLELAEAGRVVPVEDGTPITLGVTAIAAPGHSPGHVAYEVRDGDERLLVVGDAMIFGQELVDEDLFSTHDADPAVAAHSRARIRALAETPGTRVVGAHFPGLQPVALSSPTPKQKAGQPCIDR